MKKFLVLFITPILLFSCKTTTPNVISKNEFVLDQQGTEGLPIVQIGLYDRNGEINGVRVDEVSGIIKFQFDLPAMSYKPINILVIEDTVKELSPEDLLVNFKRWDFKPEFIDGKRVAQRNLTYTIEFPMEVR